MGKAFVAILTFSIILLTSCGHVFAAENSAGSSAGLLTPIAKISDSRIKSLGEFLQKYNSPLSPFASDFVEIADKYELDWKLVAAISGVESTFGQQIPYNSFNGWGWGIYGDNIIRFSSWNEGIETVSEGLRTQYIDKWGTEDVYEIGRFYAASPTWAQRVVYFMNLIEKYQNSNLVNLSISL
ncbi:MAG: hypothetical protein A3C22_00715 [Candidatus Levybacteria bacterium RIFCSPHIGHO2_02_FULL_37_10]|nr:MAG: hypothetical protein A3C22_00715 [Candidatus Levybacteria bacterium RIFCSPHIGHO2_02_FULL_37_10]OGH42003.1 MAG: hypothetical protein A3H79_00230 [Candidatus Levybacteria bacterium RIFCSPLOWO2_02_FULL_36_8b]